MAEKIKFIGNGRDENKGEIHFSESLSDFTLRGVTLDHDENTAGDYIGTSEKVNCPHCIAIVEFCKTVKKSEYMKLKD